MSDVKKIESNVRLKLDFKNQSIVVSGMVILIHDPSGQWVSFIPSLNLSGHGNTINQAIASMEVGLHAFADDLFEAGEKRSKKYLLEELGFVNEKYFKKQYRSEAYIDVSGMLRDFDLPEDSEVNQVPVLF